MQHDDIGYLNTFSPDVVAMYRSDEDYHREKMGVGSIDDWITEREHGFDRRTQSLFNFMKMEFRRFDSYNGDGAIYAVDISRPADIVFRGIMEDAHDIVDVEGNSILGKTNRMELYKMGPEYYIVPKHAMAGTPTPMIPELHPSRYPLMSVYARGLLQMLKDIFSKQIVEETSSPGQAKKLYENLHKFLEEMFEKAVSETNVVGRTSKIKICSDDILKMIRSSCFTGYDYKNKKGLELFKKSLINGMVKSYGAQFFHWMDDLPKFWNGELYKGTPTSPLRKEDEIALVTSSIGQMLEKNHPYPLEDLLSVAVGKPRFSFKSERDYSQDKTENIKICARKFVFDGCEAPCNSCFSMECKLSKHGRKNGKVAYKANPTHHCPDALFKERLHNDVGFSKMMTKLTNGLKNKEKRSNEFRAAVICRKDRKFDPTRDVIPKGKIVRNDGIVKLQSPNNKSEYNVIGNRISNMVEKNDFGNFIEYENSQDFPGVVILLETNDDDDDSDEEEGDDEY